MATKSGEHGYYLTGNMATKEGNMATTKEGNMATTKEGNMATTKEGNMATTLISKFN